jgi:hypothetical protein
LGAPASTRWLAAIAAVVVGVVAVSTVVALAAGRGEEDFPPGTPEGTVQGYLRAVIDRDPERALDFLAPELLEDCDTDEYRRSIRNMIRSGDREVRASLLGTRQRDDVTEVEVRITESYGDGPFGRNEYSQEHFFVLDQVEGEWRFVEPPWPLYACPKPVAPRAVPRS